MDSSNAAVTARAKITPDDPLCETLVRWAMLPDRSVRLCRHCEDEIPDDWSSAYCSDACERVSRMAEAARRARA